MPVAFGRHVLHQKLATGGMAEIFLATAKGEAGFEKPCVVKRVLPHLAADPQFISMFLDEARLVARLHHPGIPQIFDLGSIDGAYYLAMEYLPGADLAQVMRRCVERRVEFPLDVAARIASSAAEALHYAHEARDGGTPLNIVHRDVSPSNLFLTFQGSLKVLDFGIARASRRQQTVAGVVKGKTSYMSPEQARGERVDRRADVWSLGVTLHEMLTGRRLFTTPFQVQQGPIPAPGSWREGLPPELDRIILKAVERNLEARYPTADAFREELERFLADRSYVPQSTQLAHFLRTLFTAEEIEAREETRIGNAEGTRQVTGAAAPSLVEDTRAAPQDSALANAQAVLFGEETDADRTVTQSPPDATFSMRPAPSDLPVPNPNAPRLAVSSTWLVLALGVLMGLGGLLLLRQAAPRTRAWSAPAAVAPPVLESPAAPAFALNGAPLVPAAEPTPELHNQPPRTVVSVLPSESATPEEPVGPPTPHRRHLKVTSASRPREREARLRPRPAEEPGKLTLVMRGAGTLFVDGRKVGEVPPNNVLMLPPGEHSLEILNPHAEPFRTRVHLRPGEAVERTIQLQPQEKPL